MLEKYFTKIECGETLPLNNPYACSVSMPTIQDVIDYEEERNNIFKKIKSGYPRIIFNPCTIKLIELIKQRNQIGNGKKLFLLPSVNALKILSTLVDGRVDVYYYKELVLVAIDQSNKSLIDKFYGFIKHTGYTVYSRQAEDLLKQFGLVNKQVDEEVIIDEPELHIKNKLAADYILNSLESILLSSSGMNSIFSTYLALKSYQEKRGRKIFVQFGWLYVDSIKILEKLSGEVKVFTDVSKTIDLEEYLEKNGNCVAGIFTETISNPLIKTPDLKKIKILAEKYDIPVLLDNTFSTPYNTNAYEYCDVLFESLTKFACGHGDVILGSAMRTNNSIIPEEVFSYSENFIEKPYVRDLQRIAYEISDYEIRIELINKNALELVEYLKTKNEVDKIYYAFSEDNISNYKKIAKNEKSIGGVISIVLNKNFEKFYDLIELPKGPSLGTNFTLLMPYTLLAHYDLTKTSEGNEYLNKLGLSKNLIRISVGLEPIKKIIDQFESAFNKLR